MRNNTEIPASVLDASRTESTFPEASAPTDATQVGALVPTKPIPEPGSSEETVSSGTEEANMAISTAPDVAQEQDKELERIAEAEYLQATDDEGSRQAQVTKPEKKAASASRRDHNKKKDRTRPREQSENMTATEACRVAQSDFWPFGMQGPATEMPRQFVCPLTDMGNCQMFADRFAGRVKYVREFGKFIVWKDDSRQWATEEKGGSVLLNFLVMDLVDARYKEADSKNALYTVNNESISPDEVLKWAKASSQRGRITAMLELVKGMEGVSISQSSLDVDDTKIGASNGVLDLVTGSLEENKPEYLITRYARAAFHPDAAAPAFMKFINEVCTGNLALVKFFQEVLGYTLSGLTKEQVFFLLLGTGANGKSTLVETFYHLMGDYAKGMPSHAFIKSESRAIRNDLARLPGVRFAPCAEINTGKALDESMVKRATGNDVMTARFIGKEFFDFHLIAKFFFSVNTLPRVTGADNGIYRRLVVIPFEGDFQATMDKELLEKLKAEIDGILTWAVQGFQRWYGRGNLILPDCVVEASKAYRVEMDTVQSFLDEMCIRDENATTPLGPLFEAYQQWGKDSLTEPVKKQLFTTLMGQKGFKKVKSGVWRWKGVTLKAASPAAETSVFGVPAAPATTAPEPSTTGLTQ